MGPCPAVIRLTSTVPRGGRRWVHPRRINVNTPHPANVEPIVGNPNNISFGHQSLVGVGVQQAVDLSGKSIGTRL